MAKGWDARTEDYELFEIFGQTAIFTNNRLDRSTVPDNAYAYDLRDAFDGVPGEVKTSVVVNHFGTIITKKPIEGADHGVILTPDDYNFIGDEMSLDDFMKNT